MILAVLVTLVIGVFTGANLPCEMQNEIKQVDNVCVEKENK